MGRVVEVHEDELALPPRGPQGVGEAAPVEERVVGAVLLLEHAEEDELLGDERRRKERRRRLRRWLETMGDGRVVVVVAATARDRT